MLKKIIFNILIILFLPWLTISIYAQEFPNNKFGIHLAQPSDHDLEAAARLVNSSGGDWGYITLVIQDNDRNYDKWQEIFNKLRRFHLIPIVRLATRPEGSVWRRPSKSDIPSWVSFLNSLNWVIKNRYIILFNEPNHASEWGGAVDPASYAEICFSLAKALKEKNPDFFVMLAGFDAAAPSNPPYFEDEERFLRKIIDFQPLIFDYIDGWASHSYPKDYTGSPYGLGRNSIRTYEWELNLLRNLEITKHLPVFITETGWIKKIKNQKSKIKNYLDEETVAQYFKIAFENVWLPDQRVWAVTPFILNYQSEPFLDFSWRFPGEGDFYPQYYLVQAIPKIKGEPKQEINLVLETKLPTDLIEQSSYLFKLAIKNQGQAILDNDYQMRSVNKDKTEIFFSNFTDLEPFHEQIIDFHFKTGDRLGKDEVELGIYKDDKKIVDLFTYTFNIFPWPSLDLKVSLFPKFKTKGDDFEIQIFDQNEQLVYKKKMVSIKNGLGRIERIANINLNETHRVVILKSYYLPRQAYVVFQKEKNKVIFQPMLPLDFNGDGKFSLVDFLIFTKPQFFLP